ncbi:MAG TPA: hypothetical protein VKP66_21795 [Steroidobacteraceae bacterium]|nr:hypothetical protein [Steroidobacteraceae bacterium]
MRSAEYYRSLEPSAKIDLTAGPPSNILMVAFFAVGGLCEKNVVHVSGLRSVETSSHRGAQLARPADARPLSGRGRVVERRMVDICYVLLQRGER